MNLPRTSVKSVFKLRHIAWQIYCLLQFVQRLANSPYSAPAMKLTIAVISVDLNIFHFF